jgi:hypothetical protein
LPSKSAPMAGVASVASAMTTPSVAIMMRYSSVWVVWSCPLLGVEVGVVLDRWQGKLKPSPRHAKTRARSRGEREASDVSKDTKIKRYVMFWWKCLGWKSEIRGIFMCSPKRVAVEFICITMPTATIGQAANAPTKLGCEVHSHPTPLH